MCVASSTLAIWRPISASSIGGSLPARAIRARERLALEVLHDQVRVAGVMADVEDLDDAGVLDPADRARLVEEALDVLGVLGDVGVAAA